MADSPIKADPYIKPDPEGPGASPATLPDEDIYEDAGDLEFSTDPKFAKVYLARVSKDLWKSWSSLDDDAEIQIGTIRQSYRTVNGQQRTQLQMLLRSDLEQHQQVPKEYELDITSEHVRNTFVFTEQDLPGFKSRSRTKFDPESANMPARLTRPKFEKTGDKQPYDKTKRFQPYFKKAIPKKTTLAGTVAHEVNCIAVKNAESDALLATKTIEAMKPKAGTIYVGDASTLTNNFIMPGTVRAQGTFGGFIKNTPVNSKKSTQEAKTARIPQNELFDLIFACFRKYNYWSMKSLRAELRQPEAYLRETLEKVADMPKSGRFAMHWTLKPEFKNATNENANDGSAPTADTSMEGAEDSEMGEIDDDEDEDVKFEEIMPS